MPGQLAWEEARTRGESGQVHGGGALRLLLRDRLLFGGRRGHRLALGLFIEVRGTGAALGLFIGVGRPLANLGFLFLLLLNVLNVHHREVLVGLRLSSVLFLLFRLRLAGGIFHALLGILFIGLLFSAASGQRRRQGQRQQQRHPSLFHCDLSCFSFLEQKPPPIFHISDGSQKKKFPLSTYFLS